MDGYIKKSEAVDVIVKYPYEIAGKTATAIKIMEDLPSADVVPKSEVEKLEQAGTRLVQEKDALIKNYAECMKDYAREIFAEIEKIAILNDYLSVKDFYTEHPLIAELKKKYIGE